MEYYLGLNGEKELNSEMLKKFSGVGMIRGENLCISRMQYFTIPDFCDYVTSYLNDVARIFSDKPVWYRTADLVPHQINLLEGCDMHIKEEQYLIGNRAIRRNLMNIPVYQKELESFVEAYRKNPNLGLLIPFVSNLEEIEIVKELLKKLNYDGKIGIMIEIPSTLFILDEINALGIDNYTIGMNDLTTMILGSKRDISTYSMNDIAVKRAVEFIIEKIHSLNKKITLAGYLNEETLKYAENMGIDRINIHYNEIPLFFDTNTPEEYTKQYDEIKKVYKRIKEERKNQ